MKSSKGVSTPSSAKRRYDGSGRQEEARLRRRRVIDAAHHLFLERGYTATSIDEIARDAQVSPQTVYAAFTSKAGVLARVIDVAIGGDDEDVMVRDRPEFREITEARTPGAFLAATIHHARQTHERSAPIIHLLESVAGTEPALAALAKDIRRQAYDETTHVVGMTPPEWLRPDLDADTRTAVAFLLSFHGTWTTLVEELGWSPDSYETFLATTLGRLLLRDVTR
jgi:AcrR family transcriptional regulator